MEQHRPGESEPLSPRRARERFVRTVSGPDDRIDLAETALLLAAEEYPALDLAGYLTRLDELAAKAGGRLAGLDRSRPESLIARFHAFLYAEEGFKGNEQDYYDPRNSFLNEVLDRRVGIPISLAVVYLEVARRLGLGGTVSGVGFPGHFLVKWQPAEGAAPIMVDPFQGTVLSQADCQKLLRKVGGNGVPLRPELLATLPIRGILVRMLANLKGAWMRRAGLLPDKRRFVASEQSRADLLRAIGACDRILLLQPLSLTDLRDRGLLWLRLECARPALADLEEFVKRAPGSPDALAITDQLPPLRSLVSRIC